MRPVRLSTCIPNYLSFPSNSTLHLFHTKIPPYRLWGNAETTVTIIAASIPMLRVMLRDATNSRRAYGSTDYYKDNGLELRQPNTRVVTITSGAATRDVEMAKHLDDNDSGKGILDDAGDKFRNERFAGGIHELKTFTGYVTQSV